MDIKYACKLCKLCFAKSGGDHYLILSRYCSTSFHFWWQEGATCRSIQIMFSLVLSYTLRWPHSYLLAHCAWCRHCSYILHHIATEPLDILMCGVIHIPEMLHELLFTCTRIYILHKLMNQVQHSRSNFGPDISLNTRYQIFHQMTLDCAPDDAPLN